MRAHAQSQVFPGNVLKFQLFSGIQIRRHKPGSIQIVLIIKRVLALFYLSDPLVPKTNGYV
jgi:hypothetical protein